tara:strand:+ start:3136 stop:3381 length:246 start_codon:yes stop_codon:yes gene_type:complete
MFSQLEELKTLLSKEIHYAEDDFDKDTNNHYYLGKRDGLEKALNYIIRIEAKEYSDLDKWAKTQMKGKDNHEHRDRNNAGH